MRVALPGLSLVIPTYRREQVLLDTLRRMHDLDPAPDEILVVDQTGRHEPPTEEALQHLHDEGWIRWIRLPRPSIPHAMNVGLLEARHEIVLFTDDDVVPDRKLVAAHLASQRNQAASVVAGRVFQPWDTPGDVTAFTSPVARAADEFMGGNVSMKRDAALALGGFDENFVKAAYRFEKEFSARVLQSGRTMTYAPEAILEHLKAESGGTRGHGRPWISPGHGVGEHYYLLRTLPLGPALRRSLGRILRAPLSRAHLRAPWRTPVTFAAECIAFLWAILLAARGPRLLSPP